MKKLLVFLVLVAMTISLFACADTEAEKETIRIAGLKGPTSIGLVKVMKDNADGNAANKCHEYRQCRRVHEKHHGNNDEGI